MTVREEILQYITPTREDDTYLYFQADPTLSNTMLLVWLGYHVDIHKNNNLVRIHKHMKQQSAPEPNSLYEILLQAFNITNITETPTQINFDTTNIDVVLALGTVDVVSTYQETNKGYRVTVYLK